MKIKIIIFLCIVSPLLYGFEGDTSVTPYLHQWYDARKTQMKFNFDYNFYSYQLMQVQSLPTIQGSLVPMTGGVSYTNDMVQLLIQFSGNLGANSGSTSGYTQINTKEGINWASGLETHFLFTAAMPNWAGTIQISPPSSMAAQARIGIFDANNGVGIMAQGTASSIQNLSAGFAVFVRSNGVENIITSLSGTAPSNITELNLYRIVVSDKLTGPITFEFYNGTTNTWTVIHQITHAQSSLSLPYIRTGNLPLMAQAYLTVSPTGDVTEGSSNATVQLNTSGWHVQTVGNPIEGDIRTLSAFSGTVAASSTEQHVMTIKNNGIQGAKTNYVTIRLKSIGGAGTAATWFQLYKNATLSGTTYSNIDVNNSVTQVTTTGTYTVGTGTKVFATAYNPTSGNVPPYGYDEVRIMVYPNETLTITSQLPFDASGSVFASFAWDEYF